MEQTDIEALRMRLQVIAAVSSVDVVGFYVLSTGKYLLAFEGMFYPFLQSQVVCPCQAA